VDPAALAGLEAFRVHLGRPVIVSSACRCEKHNRKAGGSKNSLHLTIPGVRDCQAFDILVMPLPDEPAITETQLMQIFELWDRENTFMGRGIYPLKGIIHIDNRTTGNGEVVRWWEFKRGVYSYVHKFEFKRRV